MSAFTDFLDKYKKIKRLHLDTYENILYWRGQAERGNLPLEDLAEAAYVLRRASEMAEDLRKELKACGERLEQLTCLLWVQKHTNNPDKAKPIRTTLITASPHVGQMATLPRLKKDPKKFALLMNFLGAPPETHALLQPRWTAMTEYLNCAAAEGRPFPPGIDPNKMYPTYALRFRAKKDLE